eukprot:GFYU01009668.1.p1 GENE.GFYU01009668.1~~GFYU01009668.1.p1  ORF type:complete len:196 (-),score=58.16 GFYU01009668.1:370-957(-)
MKSAEKKKPASEKEEVTSALSRVELEELKKVFTRVDTKKDAKLDAGEIRDILMKLGYEPKKNEVADMIWEVDENCDNAVDWDEFVTMFVRCRTDTTGNEPRKLFDLVEFLLYDKDSNGVVTVDECMRILFARYGRKLLESEIRALFPGDDTDINTSMTYQEYLKQVHHKFNRQNPEEMTKSKRAAKYGINRKYIK